MTILDAGSYRIHMERGSLDALGELLAAELAPCRILPVSDDNVWPLYGETAVGSLKKAGFDVCPPFVFPHGEENKSAATWEAMATRLVTEEITRSDCVLALGGGVVGDLAGFASAVHLRGIRFVQIPTSLLAMVDASVGGKTAIDLPAGKNQIGAFHEPSFVLCDPDVLGTLPASVYAEGMAEIVKTAILTGGELFRRLTANDSVIDDVIADCIRYKIGVVQRDLYDKGERQLLNLGHTAAHAIELLSDYAIPHGYAVAAGLSLITRSAAAAGFCAPDLSDTVDELLARFSLPFDLWKNYAAEAIADAAVHDKKRRGDTVTLVLPERIGSCRLVPLEIGRLADFFRAGMEANG